MDSFSAPQDLQSLQPAPSSYPRPVPGDLCGHSGVVRDAMFPPANAAGNHRPVEHWEDIPLLIENNAAQGQPQGVLYVDMGYYNMGNDHPTLRECHDNAIDNHANVALDVPVQGHAAPLAPEIDIFDGQARDAAAGPGPAFLEWAPQGPVNVPANEVLRQLAILYLREPNSQVAVLRMEPSHAHGVRVFITVELGNL